MGLLLEKPKMTQKQNKTCPCQELDCERHGNCEECQEYHKKHKSKTSCGK